MSMMVGEGVLAKLMAGSSVVQKLAVGDTVVWTSEAPSPGFVFVFAGGEILRSSTGQAVEVPAEFANS